MTDRLPPPPKPLPELRPGDLFELAPGELVGRIYFTGGRFPNTWNGFRSYGPVARMRFDHQPLPRGPHAKRAIAYVAPSRDRLGGLDPLVACVLETYGSAGVIDPHTDDPWFAIWGATVSTSVLDVVDSGWIVRARGNAAISSGPRAVCRTWSRAIYRQYPEVQGIYYQTSSLPTSRSVVLFERARRSLPVRPSLNVPLAHPGLRSALERIAREYGLTLIP
jgi:hypothetical protein